MGVMVNPSPTTVRWDSRLHCDHGSETDRGFIHDDLYQIAKHLIETVFQASGPLPAAFFFQGITL
jgi:hypothetical protein